MAVRYPHPVGRQLAGKDVCEGHPPRRRPSNKRDVGAAEGRWCAQRDLNPRKPRSVVWCCQLRATFDLSNSFGYVESGALQRLTLLA